MIKRILAVILIALLISPSAIARVGHPSFTFAIDNAVTGGNTTTGNNKKDGGLSGGAVTAITLGSIGGAALLGLGGWLYKRKSEQNLAAGCIRGGQNPLIPFCMETDNNVELYARINEHYPYLKKALSLNEIHYCPNSKYLLIYDTTIEKYKFDSVKFEIPHGTKSLKITHVTDPFDTKELNIELFLYKNINDIEPESAVLTSLTEDFANGILIKSLTENFEQYPYGVYIVSNYSEKKIYAVVIEFIFRE